MAEQVKSCLQETEEVPRDITTLFDSSLYKLDTSLVPKAIKYLSLFVIFDRILGRFDNLFVSALMYSYCNTIFFV